MLVSFSLIHGKQNVWNWVSLYIEKPYHCPNSISKISSGRTPTGLELLTQLCGCESRELEQQRLSPQEKGHYTQKRGCGIDRTMTTSIKSPVGHCAWSLELLLFSCPVMSSSVWRMNSPSPEICPISRPLHRWCYPAISSSDALFFCTQSFPAYLTSMGDEYNCPKVTPSDLGTHLLVSYLFGLLYSSWGSHGKYTGVVCHSLLQWITVC